MNLERSLNFIGVLIILGIFVLFPLLSMSLCEIQFDEGIPYISYCTTDYPIMKDVATTMYTVYFFSFLLLGAPFLIYGFFIYVLIKIYFFIIRLFFGD